MFIGYGYNHDERFLFLKIMVSMGISWFFINSSVVLDETLNISRYIFGIDDWNSKESQFRLGLDQWIVYVGMLVSWIALEFDKYFGSIPVSGKLPLKDRLFAYLNRSSNDWQKIKLGFVGFSVFCFCLFFIFDYLVPSKNDYNLYHPIVSIGPILGYIIVRNWNETFRRYNSELWCWVGVMSLETFLLQVRRK